MRETSAHEIDKPADDSQRRSRHPLDLRRFKRGLLSAEPRPVRHLKIIVAVSLLLTACGREAPPSATTERVTKVDGNVAQLTPYEEAKAEFHARAELRARTLLDPRHAPLLLDHGHPTRYVVVISTGLYDSAYGQRPLAERLYKRGFNVMVPLLPGHWDKDTSRIDSASYLEYVEEQNTSVRIAKAMGQELILVGHSTGALLALRTAIEEPRVAALVVSAPAFSLSPFTEAATSIGLALGLSANLVLGKADELNTPYFSAYAGEQVRKLIKLTRNENGWERNKVPAGQSESGLYRKLFAKVKAPSVLITDDGDLTIDNHVARLMPSSVSGPNLALTSCVLGHFDVGRWPGMREDTPKERAYAAENKRLMDATETFLAQHLPGYLSSADAVIETPAKP
jgi:pimeloyl-ACP methyl ester carboxylesterase